MGGRHICRQGCLNNDVTWVRTILKYGGCYETNRKGEVTRSDLGYIVVKSIERNIYPGYLVTVTLKE